MNKNAVSKLGIGTIVTCFVLGGGFAALTAFARTPDGVIASGVRVAGMDWSNRPTSTARAELEGWSKAKADEKIVMAAPAGAKIEKQWKVSRLDLGATVDIDATINRAEEIGRSETAFTRVACLFSGRRSVEIAPVWKVDSEKVRKYLATNVAPQIKRQQKDARFVATKDGFKIFPDQPGTELDVKSTITKITERLPLESSENVELAVKTVPSRIVAADLKDIETKIGEYRTSYNETGNRAKNIEVACRHINGTVLKPGDVFSYNNIVGPREAEGGFKMAPVIISGRLVPGMGGGVCQTSSTLYNAVLLSGLEIVQRNHHAFPVHYLPAGRDATVAYGSLDFKFKNNTNGVIAIGSDGSGGQVHMRIFGKKSALKEVKIERTGVSSWGQGETTVKDSSLPVGKTETVDRGHAGHKVTVWRSFYENGKLVKKEQVSHDTYQAFPRIVAVGTKAVPPKVKPLAPGATAPPAMAPVVQPHN
ncbi:MAG: VanW family protein [Chthonomonadales bacterium]